MDMLAIEIIIRLDKDKNLILPLSQYNLLALRTAHIATLIIVKDPSLQLLYLLFLSLFPGL